MTIRRQTRPQIPQALTDWRNALLDRRAFLLRMAGGSLAALFPLRIPAATPAPDTEAAWALIGAVQDHLFPSEPEAPGAREINAVGYLQFVVGDDNLDAEQRAFIQRGAAWVQQNAQDLEQAPFESLDADARERVLRYTAQSSAGENWLSTLLLYIFEALLTDPVYGGNPDGVGWKWLGHNPGLPRPTRDKRYGA